MKGASAYAITQTHIPRKKKKEEKKNNWGKE